MRKRKTVLALVLALVMVISILPFGAAAEQYPIDMRNSKVKLSYTAISEKLFAAAFGGSYYSKSLFPTMNSLRTIGNNIYLIDYQYDYNIDDLMAKGVSSAADLLNYASKHILKGAYKFKMGQWGLGCSAFAAKDTNGNNIMGRNFDYMDAPCYVVWTHPKDAYASISMVDGTFLLTTDHLSPTSLMGRMQTLLAPYLCLDGMNEKGLAISVLQIHADGTNQNNGKTDMFTTAAIRCCLDKCKNVDEAIAMFRSFDIHDTIALGNSLGCCFHYMITDASGDAAVVEYVNNEMRITRGDNLYVTNYFRAEDGGVGMDSYDPEGMERADYIKAVLEENNGVLSFDQAFDTLSYVHLNYRHANGLYDITTLWSSLYNNDQLTMAMAARMDYDNIYTFSVTNPMMVYAHDSVAVSTPKAGNGFH